MSHLFFQLFKKPYSDLLDTIHHLLFLNFDQRLLHYLREKASLTATNPLKITHRQMANELGTAREVISRVLKMLEGQNLLKQSGQTILILKE